MELDMKKEILLTFTQFFLTYADKYEVVECRTNYRRYFSIICSDKIVEVTLSINKINNEWTVCEYGCTELSINSVDELRLKILSILKLKQPHFFRKKKIETLLAEYNIKQNKI